MTNGEKIRSMTDEELAGFLPYGDCFCCPVIPVDSEGRFCYECALAWLKSSIKEDTK